MKLEETEKAQVVESLRKRSEFEDNLALKAYEDDSFRQNLITDPKSIYEQELGTNIPDFVKIEVLEEKPNTIYLVLPKKNQVAEAEGELSEEDLEAVAGGFIFKGKVSLIW